MCVSPDYVLVPRQRQDELLEAFKAVYASFYPEGSLKSPDTARIINSVHYNRIMDLIGRTKGTIVTGGTGDGVRIDLTIVKDVALDDALMEGYVPLKDSRHNSYDLQRDIWPDLGSNCC
jgi:aldehyde dehydrogenase (NAD+)